MKILVEYLKLMRLDKPVGFMLLFLPCSFGLAYANYFTDFSPKIYLLFLYGSIVMRSAGCIINDIMDKDIDKYVERTKNRPIAAGKISVFNASVLTILLFIAGAIILFSLGVYPVYIGVFSVLLVILYPLMKRWIHYPQLFLGFTFNLGCLISFLSVVNKVNWGLLILYVGCIFWTLGYDTIYGYQDKKYDQKIGIRSSSIYFDRYSSVFLYLCYGVFVLSITFLKVRYSFFGWDALLLISVIIQLIWQIYTLEKHDIDNCFKRFKSNVLLGVLVFILL